MPRAATITVGLKHKVVGVLAAVLGLFFLLNNFVFYRTLSRQFAEVEYDSAVEESLRMVAALEVEEQRVAGYTHDWGAWTDTYRFAADLNDDYRQSNLLLPSYRNNKMQLVYLVRPDGALIWGKAYDLNTGAELALAEFPPGGLPPNHPLLAHHAVNSEVAGILATAQGPMLVASCPITDSTQRAPVRGVLIMGRFLDRSIVQRLGRQTHRLVRIAAPGAAGATGPVVKRASDRANVEIRAPDAVTLLATIHVADLLGRPAFDLSVALPRPIAARGREAQAYAMLSLAAFGVLMVAAAFLALHRAVTRPLEALTRNVLRARQQRDPLAIDLALNRGDELGVLSREFQAALRQTAEGAEELLAANRRLTDEIEERQRATAALRYRERFEQLIAQLAARFINLAAEEIDQGIGDCLRSVSEFFEVDHAYVALFSADGGRMRVIHEWFHADVAPEAVAGPAEAPTELFAWCMARLRRGELAHIPCVAELPPEAQGERELLESQRVQARVAAPIMQGAELRGCFGLDAMRAPRRWDDDSVVLLRIVAELLANALGRKETDEELRRAKAAAEAATAAKSDFLAQMSHEIRTPMNAVIGMAHLLTETGLSPDQQKYTETLRSSADALMRIINDILDLSKIEAGRLALEETTFDLRAVVEETTALHASRAAEKDIAAALRIASGAPRRLCGDPVRLRQVLGNLLANAVKFTAKGGVFIEVDAEVVERRAALTIAVSDSGVGIPPAKQQAIFERFSQADASTTRRYGGTGLGLAICRQLAELMGGGIRVESEVQRGSTFRFDVTLPLAADEPSPADPPPLAGARVLIVGDDAPAARELAAALRDGGALAVLTPVAAARAGADYDAAAAVLGPDGDVGQLGGATARLLLAPRAARREGWRWAAAGFGDVVTWPAPPAAVAWALHAVRRAARGDGPAPLRLAMRAARRPAATPPLAPEAGAEFVGRRVLLAEDNEASQRAAVWLMEKMGCRVDVAADGGDAVARAATGRYDAILMDVQMPVMDGLEATAAIRRAAGAGPRTPIIAMTANAMAGDRERCLAAGMDDYLSKPIARAELRAVLQRWFAPPAAPAARAEAGAPATFNVAAALARFGGDEDVLRGLVDVFLRDASLRAAQLASAVTAGEWPAAARLAHTTKGGASYVGAEAAQQAAAKLEAAARGADAAAAQNWLGALQTSLREFAAAAVAWRAPRA